MKKVFIGVAAAVALMGGFSVYSAYGTIETSTVTVTGKDRLVDSNKMEDEVESKWIVMTDVVSLENTDSFLHLKFNSTDLQGKLEEGKMYHVTYYGYRVPFMSMYPNIINVEEAQ